VATCVILGAGKGIGQSVAKEFKSRGYHIALCARNKEKLTELAEQLGDDTSTWTVDVADSENLKQTLADIANSQGDIEVLIYNAYSAEPWAKARPLTLINSINHCWSMSLAHLWQLKQWHQG
jgi:short-subunit dehydrogenase